MILITKPQIVKVAFSTNCPDEILDLAGGNSVCPPIASAIVKANYARIAEAVEVGA